MTILSFPRRAAALILAAGLLLAGCAPGEGALSSVPASSIPAGETSPSSSEADSPVSSQTPESVSGIQETPSQPVEPFPGAIPLGNDYIASIADQLLREIITPGMGTYEQILTVYRWLIENTTFVTQPVGLDVWQWRGDITQVPSYVENRAISPILFGMGSCEDYASAAVILLRRLGIPAEYVAGLTISVQRDFVDHAWAVVELDGVWYHLDPQLEDNVTRQDFLTYRYFLKSDETMLADHRWGENLIDYYGGSMTPQRAQNIRENWSVPECPEDWLPVQESETITQAPVPNRSQLEAQLQEERAQWEKLNGPLPPVEDNTQPPVL
jgi:hypothetical protein